MSDELDPRRLSRVEEDIQQLRRHQERTDNSIDEVRRDLRQDLRDTETRLEKRIGDSHDELVRAIGGVEEHLNRQDDLIAAAAHNETQAVAARIDWPSWRNTLKAIGALVAGYAALHYGLHIG